MTLEEFDHAMRKSAGFHKAADFLIAEAKKMEDDTLDEAGIAFVSREPGYPCWTSVGLSGYYDTPRQVLEEIERCKA